jgi:hypothetical protein
LAREMMLSEMFGLAMPHYRRASYYAERVLI